MWFYLQCWCVNQIGHSDSGSKEADLECLQLSKWLAPEVGHTSDSETFLQWDPEIPQLALSEGASCTLDLCQTYWKCRMPEVADFLGLCLQESIGSRPRGLIPFPVNPFAPLPSPFLPFPCVFSFRFVFAFSLFFKIRIQRTFLGWWEDAQASPQDTGHFFPSSQESLLQSSHQWNHQSSRNIS